MPTITPYQMSAAPAPSDNDSNTRPVASLGDNEVPTVTPATLALLNPSALEITNTVFRLGLLHSARIGDLENASSTFPLPTKLISPGAKSTRVGNLNLAVSQINDSAKIIAQEEQVLAHDVELVIEARKLRAILDMTSIFDAQATHLRQALMEALVPVKDGPKASLQKRIDDLLSFIAQSYTDGVESADSSLLATDDGIETSNPIFFATPPLLSLTANEIVKEHARNIPLPTSEAMTVNKAGKGRLAQAVKATEVSPHYIGKTLFEMLSKATDNEPYLAVYKYTCEPCKQDCYVGFGSRPINCPFLQGPISVVNNTTSGWTVLDLSGATTAVQSDQTYADEGPTGGWNPITRRIDKYINKKKSGLNVASAVNRLDQPDPGATPMRSGIPTLGSTTPSSPSGGPSVMPLSTNPVVNSGAHWPHAKAALMEINKQFEGISQPARVSICCPHCDKECRVEFDVSATILSTTSSPGKVWWSSQERL